MAKKQDILVAINNFVRKKMQEKYKSNLSFATACDVNEKTIRNLLSGKSVSINSLQKICDGLGIKLSDMLKEIGY